MTNADDFLLSRVERRDSLWCGCGREMGEWREREREQGKHPVVRSETKLRNFHDMCINFRGFSFTSVHSLFKQQIAVNFPIGVIVIGARVSAVCCLTWVSDGTHTNRFCVHSACVAGSLKLLLSTLRNFNSGSFRSLKSSDIFDYFVFSFSLTTLCLAFRAFK